MNKKETVSLIICITAILSMGFFLGYYWDLPYKNTEMSPKMGCYSTLEISLPTTTKDIVIRDLRSK